MQSFIKIIVLITLTYGCQTANPDTKTLSDQTMDIKGNATDGIIGVNAKNRLVIRKTTAAENELASVELSNTYLRTKAEAVVFDLDQCRAQRADKRLGGSGKIPPKGINVAALFQEHTTQEMGLDEKGDLQIVTEQEFTTKLSSEKKLQAKLIAITEEGEKSLEACSNDLAEARRDHGLQGKKYVAEGYYTQQGTYVTNKHGENDLDDAFELSAAKAGK